MLNYLKPVLNKVNTLKYEEQKTIALVLANVVFLALLISIAVTCILVNFL